MPSYKTFAEYLKTVPKDVQVVLKKVNETIQKTVPDAISTISYQMPSFKLNGKYLISFAGWKQHIGLYPGAEAMSKFKKKFSKYVHAKGSVQFPLDQPMPYDLIKEIVSFRKHAVMEQGSSIYGRKYSN